MSKFRVIASSLNVRQEPSKNAPILGGLPRNTIVEPLDLSEDGSWYFAKTASNGSNLEGWLFKDFLIPDEAPAAGPAAQSPAWLDIASGELGVTEIPGSRSNPRVLEYHDATSLHASDDSVPWCSSFVNWCMKQAGIQGSGSAAARSWLTWGRKLDGPQNGCIAVLRRGNSPTNGHVAFYVGDAGASIKLLGGNQSDQVKISSFPKSMLLSYRWPS